MTSTNPSTIVLLPSDGRADTVPRGTVTLDLESRAARSRWAMQLDAALRHEQSGAIAVTEGLAAVALAYWMQLSPRTYLACLRGVVLHAPATAARCAAAGFGTLPATRLPTPAIVIGRIGEDAARHLSLADRWGARFVPDHQLARACADDAIGQRLLDVARAGAGSMPSMLPPGGEVVPIRAAV